MLFRFTSMGSYDKMTAPFKKVVEHQYGSVWKVIDEQKFFLIIIKYGIEFKAVRWEYENK